MWIYLLPIILLLACVPPLLFLRHRYRESHGFQALMKRRHDPKEGERMKEMLQSLIGKKADIRTIDDLYFGVRLMEVAGNAVRVQGKKGQDLILNIDFIVEVSLSKKQ